MSTYSIRNCSPKLRKMKKKTIFLRKKRILLRKRKYSVWKSQNLRRMRTLSTAT